MLYIHSPNLTDLLSKYCTWGIVLGGGEQSRESSKLWLSWQKTPLFVKQLGSLLYSDLLLEEVVSKLLAFLECSDYPLAAQEMGLASSSKCIYKFKLENK